MKRYDIGMVTMDTGNDYADVEPQTVKEYENPGGAYVRFIDHESALATERKKAEGLVLASRKILTWIDAHPRKATIVREVIAEFRAALKAMEGE